MRKKRIVDTVLIVAAVLCAAVMVVPLLSVFNHSLEQGMNKNLSSAFYLPYPISLRQFVAAAIDDLETMYYFRNSLIITVPAVVVGMAVSLPCGYALAKFSFPLKRFWFFCYVLVMLLPVQVGIVGTYIYFDRLGLLDSYPGVILPTAFAPFASFLIYQFMCAIPDSTLESARLDGAGEFRIFLRIVLPQARAGVASMVILTMIDAWNMVEMPMILLQERTRLPMSIMLRYMDINTSGTVFAAITIFTIPLLLIFFLFEEDMAEGIAHSVPVVKR